MNCGRCVLCYASTNAGCCCHSAVNPSVTNISDKNVCYYAFFTYGTYKNAQRKDYIHVSVCSFIVSLIFNFCNW